MMTKKRNGKEIIDFTGLSYVEIGEILEKGARTKSYRGADILSAMEDEGFYLMFKKSVVPNSLFLDYMARLGFEFYRQDGKIISDDIIYLSFENTKKKKSTKLKAKADKKVEDLKDLKTERKELLSIDVDALKEELKEIEKNINNLNHKKNSLSKKVIQLEDDLAKAIGRDNKAGIKRQLKSAKKELSEITKQWNDARADRTKTNNKIKGKEPALKSNMKDIEKKQVELAKVREKLGWKFEKDEDGNFVRNSMVNIDDEEYTSSWFNVDEMVQVEDETEELGKFQTREKIYEGFTIKRQEGDITYVDHYRISYQTSAKSRLGQTIALRDKIQAFDKDGNEIKIAGVRDNSELIDELESMISFGLTDKYKGTEIPYKAVEVQAYSGLSQSAITNGYIEIDPRSILILPDVDVDIECNGIIGVEGSKEINGKKYEDIILTANKKYITKNTMFDGQSLIDASLMEGSKHQMILLRGGDMYKSASFKCNLQAYIREQYKDKSDEEFNKITVKDMFGNDIYLKDVKVITTDNSCKWVKFAKDKYPNSKNPLKDAYEDWITRCREKENLFAIVKTDKSTKYKDLVRMSYQVENTLPFSTDINQAKKEMEAILQTTLDYADKIRKDDSAFINYITSSNDEELKILSDMLERNSDLIKTRFVNDIRNDISRGIINRAKEGKLFVHGNNETLCSSPIEMIQHALGKLPLTEDGKLDKAKFINSFGDDKDVINVYCKNFVDDKLLAFARSPHSSASGLCLGQNVHNTEIDKLFGDNFSKNIIFIDSTNHASQDMLNGCDYDSDFVMTTDDENIVKLIKENSWGEERIPVNKVSMSKKQYTISEKALLDYNLSSNTIGECTNLGQIAKSQLDELIRNESKYIKQLGSKKAYQNKINGLKDVIDKLTIASNISIDNAKRAYSIDVVKFLDGIRKDECWLKDDKGHIIKPDFFKYVSREGEKLEGLTHLSCNMDIAGELLDTELKNSSKNRKSGLTELGDLLLDIDTNKVNKNTMDKVYDIIKKYDANIRALRDRKNIGYYDEDRLYEQILLEKEDMIAELKKLKINNSTYRQIIKNTKKGEQFSEIRKLTLEGLRGIDKNKFVNSFIGGAKPFSEEKMEENAIDSVKQCLKSNEPIEKDISKMHENTYKSIKKNIEQINKTYELGEITLEEANKKIDDLIDNEIANLNSNVINRLEKHFESTIEFGYYEDLYNTSKTIGLGIRFDRIPKRTLKAVLNEPFAGGNFKDRNYKNMTEVLEDNIKEVLYEGIKNGESVWNMSQKVRGELKYSQKSSERLVRTESNHFLNQGTKLAYEELDVEKYVFLATLDNRTSEKCANMDSKVFNVEDAQTGVNYPPLHPYCRSTTIMYVDDEWMESMKRRAKDKNGRSILIDNMTYKEWYNKFIKGKK